MHPAQEAGKLFARARAVAPSFEFEPGAVDGVPHLDGQRGAHRARVEARAFEAVADRRRIAGREREEFGDRFLVGLLVGRQRRRRRSPRWRPRIPTRWSCRHKPAAAR